MAPRAHTAGGRRFSAGIVLYDGETSVPFGDGLFAVPIRALWETTRPATRKGTNR